MNKKRLTEFSNYLEAFTQRIVIRFPNAQDFVDNETTQMVERFPELIPTEVESRPSEISRIKHALDSSVSEEKRKDYFGVEEEIKRDTPEECVQSINKLSTAIGSAHRDVLFYSYLQGELLSLLKDFYQSTFPEILRNDIKISRSHAFFLMKFYKLVSDFPRLLRCKLPLNFFQKNISAIYSICESEKSIWTDAS